MQVPTGPVPAEEEASHAMPGTDEPRDGGGHRGSPPGADGDAHEGAGASCGGATLPSLPAYPGVDRPPERRSDGILALTPPVRIVFDATADGRRAAYVALLLERGHKPRLLYGTGTTVAFAQVEFWALARLLRRANTRYAGQRPLLVFTDCQAIVDTRGSVHVQYRWLPRTSPLMRHLHRAANALRRSLRG